MTDTMTQAAPAGSTSAPTAQKFCSGCGTLIHKDAPACPKCGAPQADVKKTGEKSRTTAILLAFFLGGFGAHKFYLGRAGAGIIYVLFFWTLIPAIVAFIEMIIYITMSDESFARKYG